MKVKFKVLDTEAEHEAALARIYELMEKDRTEKETEELRLLVLIAEDYEERHYPIGPPGPIDAIKFQIERLGLRPKEVAALFGGPERAKAVLSGKRPITLALARRLHEELNVPADILLQRPSRVPSAAA